MTEPKTPPSEILLMRAGKTESMRGTFTLTPEAARANEGKELPIHASDFNFGDRPAGWARTQAREDGVWLTEISWSRAAKEMLAAGKQPIYIVPAFIVYDGGKVTELICASLTATPADENATRLK